MCKYTFHRPVLHSSPNSPALAITNTGEPALHRQGRASMSCVASSRPFSTPHSPCGPSCPPVAFYKDETHPQPGKLAAARPKALHAETPNPSSCSTPSRARPLPLSSSCRKHPTIVSPALGHPAPAARSAPSLLAFPRLTLLRGWEPWGFKHRPDDRADGSPDLAASC